MMDITVAAQEKMNKTMAVLKAELGTLRAGRANPHILDRVMVDYYGSPTPINQVGNISAPEPRMLVITPWDPKMIPDISKAIQKSDVGINPVDDGKIIRLMVPELTEERRKELVKTVRKRGEEAKVAIRSIRRDANEQGKKEKKNNVFTEDDLKSLETEIQKVTDQMIKDVDKAMEDKEKEIMSI